MKSRVHFKVTLNPLLFLESFRSSCVLLSNIPQIISCTMGAESFYSTIRMFFNMLMNLFSSFGFV